MSGSAELAAIIAKIKRIPNLVKETAPECAKSFHAAVTASLADGQGPNGEAWQRTKAGGAPLPNAASNAVVTKAVGTTIITAAQFPYAFHDKGARGGALPVRKIAPTRLTDRLVESIRKPLVKAFNSKVK